MGMLLYVFFSFNIMFFKVDSLFFGRGELGFELRA
jgi:hypothetical protein